MLLDWDGERVIGHDGGAVWIASRLRMQQSLGTVIAVLCNGGDGDRLGEALIAELVSELHGITPPAIEPPPAPAPRLDLARYAGVYRRHAWMLDVTAQDDRLLARLHVGEPIASELGRDTLELELAALDTTRFVQRTRGGGGAWSPLVFFEIPGHGRFVHMWSRTTPLVP
jgi:hypothetical protein